MCIHLLDTIACQICKKVNLFANHEDFTGCLPGPDAKYCKFRIVR